MAKEPKTPDDLLKIINSSVINADQSLNTNIELDPIQPPETMVNGWVTTVARDVYNATGNKDIARRADDLIYLLGNDPIDEFDKPKTVINRETKIQEEHPTLIHKQGLYDKVKIAANCHGQPDEAFWLRSQLWLWIEGETADLTGASEARTEDDDTPTSRVNALISQYIGPSQLGSIRRLAKEQGVSNRDALRAIVFNHFVNRRTL